MTILTFLPFANIFYVNMYILFHCKLANSSVYVYSTLWDSSRMVHDEWAVEEPLMSWCAWEECYRSVWVDVTLYEHRCTVHIHFALFHNGVVLCLRSVNLFKNCTCIKTMKKMIVTLHRVFCNLLLKMVIQILKMPECNVLTLQITCLLLNVGLWFWLTIFYLLLCLVASHKQYHMYNITFTFCHMI